MLLRLMTLGFFSLVFLFKRKKDFYRMAWDGVNCWSVFFD